MQEKGSARRPVAKLGRWQTPATAVSCATQTPLAAPRTQTHTPAGHDDVPVASLGQGGGSIEAQAAGGASDDHGGLLGGGLAVGGARGGGSDALSSGSTDHHAARGGLCGAGDKMEMLSGEACQWLAWLTDRSRKHA